MAVLMNHLKLLCRSGVGAHDHDEVQEIRLGKSTYEILSPDYAQRILPASRSLDLLLLLLHL